MRRRLLLASPILLSLPLAAPATAAESHVVTDQIGRKVTVPVTVRRAVVLQHQALGIIVELGAADRVVGILRTWATQIPGIDRLSPRLETLPTPGDLTTVNVEDLLRLNPDVVFVTSYAPPAMMHQLEQAGIPTIAISLALGEDTERAKLNPTFADDDLAYAEGLKEGVRVIATVMGAQARGEALLDAAFTGRRLVESRVKDIPPAQRVRLYMANPSLGTYGAGKYTGVIMARSGGINVALEIRGFAKVSMEDLLRWNPQVIFVQDRYTPVAEEIRTGAAWQSIDAVRNKRVYITPEYVKPWGHPMPEALALGELWMAKKLYPERFADIDMQQAANQFYQTFNGQPYTGPN